MSEEALPRTERDRSYRTPVGKPLSNHQQWIWDLRNAHPHLSVKELSELTREKGMFVTPSSLHQHLHRCRKQLGLEADSTRVRREDRAPKQRKRRVLREVKAETLGRAFGQVSEKFVDSLNRMKPEDIDALPAKERAIVAGITNDHRMKIKGEPTSIVELRDNRKLEEIAAGMLAEMKRRGYTIDVTPDTYEQVRVIPKALEDGS